MMVLWHSALQCCLQYREGNLGLNTEADPNHESLMNDATRQEVLYIQTEQRLITVSQN